MFSTALLALFENGEGLGVRDNVHVARNGRPTAPAFCLDPSKSFLYSENRFDARGENRARTVRWFRSPFLKGQAMVPRRATTPLLRVGLLALCLLPVGWAAALQ